MSRVSLKFIFDSFGGFIALDSNSGLTSYAHRGSAWATEAEKDPSGIARKMIRREAGRDKALHDDINRQRYDDAVQLMIMRNSVRRVDPDSIGGILKRDVPA